MRLSGYEIDDVIFENQLSLVLHAHTAGNHTPVILKILNLPMPTPHDVYIFKHEYQITKMLQQLSCILHTYALEQYKNSWMMVLEDTHGKSLAHYIEENPFSIKDFLYCAKQITAAIAEIHAAGFVHKDIKPDNIIWNKEKEILKIIGLGTATQLSHEYTGIKNEFQDIAGTLTFMSPEQTGRINRSVDQRSDLYSLGITFYMMLIKEPPFKTSDSLINLIYQHIIQVPKPLHDINNLIPEPISKIISKLLAKMPEDRYQTATGLLKDLEYCWESLLNNGYIKDFVLGTHDHDTRFIIPEKLYGREHNFTTFLDALKRMKEGRIEIVEIAGASGIGKSSFVHEIYQAALLNTGYYIEGKFDQYQNNVPSLAVSRMLRTFLKIIQTEPANSLKLWKEKLSDAVGMNGQILIDLVTEFEQFLGPQPPLVALDPIAQENRFIYTLTRVLEAIATKEHPLIIFWDDVQWADSISLKLLEAWFTQLKYAPILFIFSYRNTLPKLIYPFKLIIDRIKNEIRITTIHLSNLSLPDIQRMIADALHANNSNTIALANICLKKTLGNPFFLKQMLYAIHKKGLISFNEREHQWQIDLEKIQNLALADNVSDLMVSRLKSLQESVQYLLSVAACIGRTFSLELLSAILDVDERSLAISLHALLEDDYILPLNSNYRFAEEIQHSGAKYRFTHDKLREAAYHLLSEEEQETLHLKIGRLLLQQTKPQQLSKKIIMIMDHFNKGIELINDPVELQTMVAFNYQAGLKAKSAQAFRTAQFYFNSAIKLASNDDWYNRYQLMLDLHNNAALMSSILAKGKHLARFRDIILNHAQDVLDTVEIYRIEIGWLFSKGKPHAATELLSEILQKLDFKLPANPNLRYIIPTVIKTVRKSKKVPIQSIEKLPVLDNPRIEAILKLISAGMTTFPVNPKLFAMIMCHIFYLTLTYGRSELAPMGCVGYGCVLNYRFKKYALAYEYAQTGFALAKKYNYTITVPLSIIAYCVSVHHTSQPYREALPLLLEGHQAALLVGSFEVAILSLAIHATLMFYSGIPLPNVFEKMQQAITYSRDLKQNYEVKYLLPQIQLCQQLMAAQPEVGDQLEGAFFSESRDLPTIIANNDRLYLVLTYLSSMMLNYLFDKNATAVDYCQRLDPHIAPLTAHISYPVYLLYSSLVKLRAYPKLSFWQRMKMRRQVSRKLRALKKLAKSAPMNYMGKYYLIQAELARVKGQYKPAIDLYEQAITWSHHHEFLQDEALAYELTGKFYLEKNNDLIAKVYLLQAYYAYSAWGAQAKVEQMSAQYTWLSMHAKKGIDVNAPVSFISNTSHKMIELDYESLMKAAVAISSEINLAKIVTRLLEVLAENVAAERCVLLLKKNDVFYIEGDFSAAQGIKNLIRSIPLTSEYPLPLTLIQYVTNCNESILIDDAKMTDRFGHDPYFVNNDIKSVLCVPIIYKNVLVGVLYLENNTSKNVFTQNRLEFIRVLSSQIAVSIENARLYHTFEKFVPKEFLELLGKKNLVEVNAGDSVQKNLSVLFMDIRNFTSLAEKQNVQTLFTLLNKLLDKLTPIMTKHHGFIDKIIGDAILALFPDKADDALHAAIEMQHTIAAFNKEHHLGLRIGIGINTGLCMLGTLGNNTRMDGSVISDAVNIASRIEGLAKLYGAHILLQDQTMVSLQNKNKFSLRYVDKVVLKGKSYQNVIWESIDTWPASKQAAFFANFELYREAINEYQHANFAEALSLFQSYVEKVPDDTVGKLYVTRCQYYLKTGVPEDWQGSTVLKHK